MTRKSPNPPLLTAQGSPKILDIAPKIPKIYFPHKRDPVCCYQECNSSHMCRELTEVSSCGVGLRLIFPRYRRRLLQRRRSTGGTRCVRLTGRRLIAPLVCHATHLSLPRSYAFQAWTGFNPLPSPAAPGVLRMNGVSGVKMLGATGIRVCTLWFSVNRGWCAGKFTGIGKFRPPWEVDRL